MALTRIIGDVHGLVNDMKAYCVYNWKGPFVQVGDLGVGFGQSDYWHENLDDFFTRNNGKFIRGNHDNPEQCKTMSSWIKDGLVENNVMYIGGAWSIDNPNAPPGWYKRTAGHDWWPEEELSDLEFNKILDIYKVAKPEVLITHDCPESIAISMFKNSGLVKGTWYKNRTSAWLETFYEVHKPKFWFFGHWHHTMQYIQGSTMFHCLGELSYTDFDFETLEYANEKI